MNAGGTRRAVVVALTLVGAAGAAAQDDPALARGRRLAGWLLDGRADSIVSRMAPDFVASVGGPSGVTELVQRGHELGRPSGPLDEAVYREAGTISYYLIGRFETMPSATIQWVWDTAGVIQGMLVRPTPESAPSKFADRETRTPLRLPFEGPAYVAWGGRLPHQNYHVQNIQQRFAYDFFLLEDGQIRQGRGEVKSRCSRTCAKEAFWSGRATMSKRASPSGHVATAATARRLTSTTTSRATFARTAERDFRRAFGNTSRNGRDVEAGEPVRGQTVAAREEASRLPAGSR